MKHPIQNASPFQTKQLRNKLNKTMNEEYVKHLMKQRKGESPIQLWMEFVGIQLVFGFLLVAIVGLCLWAAS
jgi:hypothetical protein